MGGTSAPARSGAARRAYGGFGWNAEKSLTYALVVALVAAVSATRVALDPVLKEDAPLMLYTLAVVLASWYGGRNEGLFATSLSLLVGRYLFVAPQYTLAITPGAAPNLLVFAALGTAISVFVGRGRKTAEALLEKELEVTRVNDRLSEVLEIGSDCVFLLDREWRFAYLNPRAVEQIAGGQDLLGISIWEAFPEAVGTTFHREYRRAMLDEVPVSFTEFYAPLSTWFEVRVFPSDTGLAVYFRNINQRKKAEDAIRESEQRFRLLIEQASDAILIAGPDGRYIDANTAACRMLGYTPEELSGKPVDDLTPPEDEDKLKAARASLSRGESVLDEWRLVRKDGGTVPVEISAKILPDKRCQVIARDITMRKQAEAQLVSILESITDAFIGLDREYRLVYTNSTAERMLRDTRSELAGKVLWDTIPAALGTELIGHYRTSMEARLPVTIERYFEPWDAWYEVRMYPAANGGISVVFHDITQRKLTEIALNESEKRFRSTFENAAVGIAHLGADGAWLRVNDRLCEIAGYSRAELSRLGIQDITHPDDIDLDAEQLRRLLAGEISGYSTEKRFFQRDGSLVWVNLTSAIERSRSGETLHLICVVEDITERKRAEQALRIVNGDLRQFAYATSHDLQEPLRMVVSFTQLLRRRYENRLDRDAHQYMDYAVSGARRMEALLHGLRAYWTAGERETEEEAVVDVRGVMADVLLSLEPAIASSGAEITFGELPDIVTGRIALTDVFGSLIENAIRFRQPGVPPRIHVSAHATDRFWRFEVRDNGLGVPEQYRERIFGLFKRLHSFDRSGSGIGLALCHKIVERRGGKIWVEPNNSEGSVFCFTLPFKESPGAINKRKHEIFEEA
jgi:PAS domain S-box-containing protein